MGDIYLASLITLQCSQLPNCVNTEHIISVGTDNENLIVIETIQKKTIPGEIIHVRFEPSDIRFIRVHTVSSPSWVAWESIKVYQSGSKTNKSARK